MELCDNSHFFCITDTGTVANTNRNKSGFWGGFGCTVLCNGPLISFLKTLTKKHRFFLSIPKHDAVSSHLLEENALYFKSHNISNWLMGSLTWFDSPLVIQLPQDDIIFEKGDTIIADKIYTGYEPASLVLNKKFDDKIDDFYWAGRFSGGSDRVQVTNEFKKRGFTNVNMVDRWNYKNLPCVPLQPYQAWNDYKKVLIVDGNGVAGNATLNSLLNAVVVFYGKHKPIWMRHAIEGVHYHHIKDDFSNFDEVLAFTFDDKSNTQMVRRLNEHMSLFLKREVQERLIESQILKGLKAIR